SPPSPTHWCVEDGAPTVEAWVDTAVSDEQREGATLRLRIEDSGGKSVAESEGTQARDGNSHMSITSKELPLGEYKLIAELRPRSGNEDAADDPDEAGDRWRPRRRPPPRPDVPKSPGPARVGRGGRFRARRLQAGYAGENPPDRPRGRSQSPLHGRRRARRDR